MYEQKEAKCLAELKLVSPLLSNMEVVSCISARGAVSVYLVKSTKTAQTYILKHISVPESQKQVDALLFTGAASSTEDAQKYYEQVVTDYREELETLEQLAASPNLDCFRSYQIEPKEDGVGFDIYLLAEHRTTLSEYLADNAITHLCAVNLAMDLCSALVDLRAAGLVHRDVKPENIILRGSEALLIDFDAARLHKPEHDSDTQILGTTGYAAPEQYGLSQSDIRTDIYSLGILINVMLTGEHPSKHLASGKMGRIVDRCTHVNPQRRYKNVLRLMEAL